MRRTASSLSVVKCAVVPEWTVADMLVRTTPENVLDAKTTSDSSSSST